MPPKPGRTALWVIALTIAILFSHWKLFYPGQYTLLDDEAVRQAYSWFTFWRNSMLNGSLPLWDPYAFGGYSFPGEMQTAPFYPLYLLLLPFHANRFGLLPIPLFNALFLIAHVIAALLQFAFLRELRSTRFAAFVGAFAFTTGSFIGGVGWPHMLQSAIWLPALALFLFRALHSATTYTTIRNALFSGFFLGLSLLAGGLHIVIAQSVFLVTAAAYFAFLTKHRLRQSALVAIVTTLAGIGIGAIQLLPSYLYAKHSIRVIGDAVAYPSNTRIPYTFLTHHALFPRALATFLFPSFTNVGVGDTWTPYIGVLPFLLACFAIVRFWSHPWVRYFTVLAAAVFLYSLTGSNPLHGVLYVITPYLWMARESPRFLYLAGFCLSVLAPLGLDALCSTVSETPLFAKLRAKLSVAIWVCVLLFLAPPFFPQFLAGEESFSLLCILLTSTLLYFAVANAGFRQSPYLRVLTILLVFFDLAHFTQNGANKLENVHGGIDDSDVLNSLKGPADFLKRQPAPFRVKVQRDPEPNLADAYSLQGVAGGAVTGDRYSWRVLPFSDLMNVSYIIRPASASDPAPLYGDKFWKIYRNPNAFPRAWIVHRFEVHPNDDELYEQTRTHLGDLHQVALLAEAPSAPIGEPRSGSESVQIDRYAAREIRLAANATAPGLLILSEMFCPEWHAMVNGREVPILRADQALRAIAIPAGQSTVTLTFRPTSVYLGAALSALTATLVLIALLIPPKTPARSPETAF